MISSGSLYIVATPIGNLEDITYRAVRILGEVDAVACEDTRVTSFLLTHYDIKKPLIIFNAQNESKKINDVIERVKFGESIALVSDAGTPGISDPGIRLVHKAIEEDIDVVGVPGPNAAIMALSISGLPTDAFVYEGFIPQKKGRQKLLKELAEEKRTIVIYESMYRIEKLLTELNEYMPQRQVAVGRELTKKFEEFWRGTPSQILEDIKEYTVKGEFVVIIAPLNWRVEG